MKTRFNILAILCLCLSACFSIQDNLIHIPVPVVVDVKPDTIYICKISAFTETYQAENTSRSRAFLDTKKQCVANFDEMFCRDEDIKCTKYE